MEGFVFMQGLRTEHGHLNHESISRNSSRGGLRGSGAALSGVGLKDGCPRTGRASGTQRREPHRHSTSREGALNDREEVEGGIGKPRRERVERHGIAGGRCRPLGSFVGLRRHPKRTTESPASSTKPRGPADEYQETGHSRRHRNPPHHQPGFTARHGVGDGYPDRRDGRGNTFKRAPSPSLPRGVAAVFRKVFRGQWVSSPRPIPRSTLPDWKHGWIAPFPGRGLIPPCANPTPQGNKGR
jgi:hypothetical protein